MREIGLNLAGEEKERKRDEVENERGGVIVIGRLLEKYSIR